MIQKRHSISRSLQKRRLSLWQGLGSAPMAAGILAAAGMSLAMQLMQWAWGSMYGFSYVGEWSNWLFRDAQNAGAFALGWTFHLAFGAIIGWLYYRLMLKLSSPKKRSNIRTGIVLGTSQGMILVAILSLVPATHLGPGGIDGVLADGVISGRDLRPDFLMIIISHFFFGILWGVSLSTLQRREKIRRIEEERKVTPPSVPRQKRAA